MSNKYVCGFNTKGEFLAGCVYKDEISLNRPKLLNEQVSLTTLETEEDFKLYTSGYIRENGLPVKPIVPTLPIEEIKQEKLTELKSTRDYLEVLPIEYNGKFYDYDEKSRDRIKDAQEALEGTELSIEWTTADNTDATLFYQDFKNIRKAVAMRADALHKKYRILREQVDNAQTIEEVEAITWGMEITEEGVVE